MGLWIFCRSNETPHRTTPDTNHPDIFGPCGPVRSELRCGVHWYVTSWRTCLCFYAGRQLLL